MLSQKISYTEVAEAKRMFEACRNVVIVSHISADGDAIGSSLGLYEYLKKKGKQVTVIMPNYFPDFLKWMTDADRIIQYDRRRAMAKTSTFSLIVWRVIIANTCKQISTNS